MSEYVEKQSGYGKFVWGFVQLNIYNSAKITWTLSSLVLSPCMLRIKTGLSTTWMLALVSLVATYS